VAHLARRVKRITFLHRKVIVVFPLSRSHPISGVKLLWSSDPLSLVLLLEGALARRVMIRVGEDYDESSLAPTVL